MSRRLGVAAALILAGTAAGAPLVQPSERSCLLAWNAPANQANRAKLLTVADPTTPLSLRAGESFTYTWKKGTATTRVSSQACLLTVAKATGSQVVTGTWNVGRVTHWSWKRALTATSPISADVKLLPDGRVTKIYRR